MLNVKTIDSAMRTADEKRDELLEECDQHFYNSTQHQQAPLRLH
jgi:hypothetical protein